MGIKEAEEGHTLYKSKRGGVRMRKGLKPKKEKVHKLTEAEYAEYLSTLRGLGEETPAEAQKQEENKQN